MAAASQAQADADAARAAAMNARVQAAQRGVDEAAGLLHAAQQQVHGMKQTFMMGMGMPMSAGMMMAGGPQGMLPPGMHLDPNSAAASHVQAINQLEHNIVTLQARLRLRRDAVRTRRPLSPRAANFLTAPLCSHNSLLLQRVPQRLTQTLPSCRMPMQLLMAWLLCGAD